MRDDKNHTVCHAKCQKSRMICYAKNVENPTTFAEGFGPEFQARGRFMKYSMSAFFYSSEKRLQVSGASQGPPGHLV